MRSEDRRKDEMKVKKRQKGKEQGMKKRKTELKHENKRAIQKNGAMRHIKI